MSDLHLEVGRQYESFDIPVRGQFLILAGDIGRLADYEPYLCFLERTCSKFVRVFLVLGNHEFFGVSHEEGIRLAKQLSLEPRLSSKLTILDRHRFDIQDDHVTFLGCTLQSHIPPEAHDMVRQKVNDFRHIVNWTVDDHNAEHERDVQWLKSEIARVRAEPDGQARRIVVVTHHAPSVALTSEPKDRGSPWSSAFSTDLLGMGGDFALSALDDVQWWIFGHTHFTTSLTLGQVRLVSNQRGYVFPRAGRAPAAPTSISLRESITRLWERHRIREDVFDVRRTITV